MVQSPSAAALQQRSTETQAEPSPSPDVAEGGTSVLTAFTVPTGTREDELRLDPGAVDLCDRWRFGRTADMGRRFAAQRTAP